MTDHSAREVWLRGPLPGYPPQAMPVAQSLLQTAEEVERAVRRPHPLTRDELWARPGGAASAGYHLAHLAGSTDRLLAYAAGRALSAEQLEALGAEDALLGPGDPAARPDPEALLAAALAAVARAADAARDTPPDHRVGAAVPRRRARAAARGAARHHGARRAGRRPLGAAACGARHPASVTRRGGR
jgi:hypothetical protein